jgi:hypothetical protein
MLNKTLWQCAVILILFNPESYGGIYDVLFPSGEAIRDYTIIIMQLVDKQCSDNFHQALLQIAYTFYLSGVTSQFRGVAIFVIFIAP